MTRLGCIVCWIIAFVGLCGCERSDAPQAKSGAARTEQSGGKNASAGQNPKTLTGAGEPDAVVRRFLEALAGGDEQTAERLLTSVARKKTREHGLVVQPPGSPGSSFQLGRIEYSDDRTAAYVSSLWTQPHAPVPTSGSPGRPGSYSFEVVWVLRREAEQWRVAGMATEPVEGKTPLLFNFESPAEMLTQWRKAHTALAAQAEQDSPQSSQVRQAQRSAGEESLK